jgi:anti-anti-sigma factor
MHRAGTPVVVTTPGRGQRVILAGRVDVTCVADLRTVLHQAIDDGTGELHVDVSDLILVDAAGLGVLLGAHRRAERAGRELILSNVPEDLGRLLFKTRLYRVLHVDRGPAAITPVQEPAEPRLVDLTDEPRAVIRLPDAGQFQQGLTDRPG